MARKLLFIVIALFCGFTAFATETPAPVNSPANSPDNSYRVLVEKQLLETELELAKTNKLYFLFNLPENKIYVKSKGVVLRDWEMDSCRYWGHALAVKATALVKKSAFMTPKREDIIPVKKDEDGKVGQEEEKKKTPAKAPELQALELPDMPSIYTIALEGNLRIYIRTKSRGFISRLNYFRLAMKWNTYPPMLTLWYALKAVPFTALDIVLKSKEDAQALYWTFTEECKAIILPPREYYVPFPPAVVPAAAPAPGEVK